MFSPFIPLIFATKTVSPGETPYGTVNKNGDDQPLIMQQYVIVHVQVRTGQSSKLLIIELYNDVPEHV